MTQFLNENEFDTICTDMQIVKVFDLPLDCSSDCPSHNDGGTFERIEYSMSDPSQCRVHVETQPDDI